MSPLLQRLTAWLCLATALLTGSVPAQGFVLCIEGDGCVRFELVSASEECGGCDAHVDEAQSAQRGERLGEDSCPCVDLLLRVSPETTRLLPAWIPLPPAPRVSCVPAGFQLRPSPAPRAAPRPPDSLTLIRSVVLLV
jgi:hypothetical protein